MNRTDSINLGEYYEEFTHKSGLNVLVYPKTGYSKTYAVIATNYGSIDNSFIPLGKGEPVTVPGGIAHYLEHKLFEGEDKNAFERYAKTGANANAFTSFDTTAYLFSCTENFEASLEILLDFVSSPYFTKENVDKERGIIGQEIRMYDDSSDWQVFFGVLQAAYKNHPLKDDIAGTIDTIAKITPELLYSCYNNFYNPSEMVLCICGDVKTEDVEKICDKVLKEKEPSDVKRIYEPEPELPNKKLNEKKMQVSKTIFNMGVKDKIDNIIGKELVKKKAVTEILLEMLVGKSSPLYKKLYDERLIGIDFSSEYMLGHSYGIAVLGGESSNPEKVYTEFFDEAKRQAQNFSEEDFRRCQKAIYGKKINLFNSVENLGNQMVSCYFDKTDVFDVLTAYGSVTPAEAQSRLASFFDERYGVLSIIRPTGQQE